VGPIISLAWAGSVLLKAACGRVVLRTGQVARGEIIISAEKFVEIHEVIKQIAVVGKLH
jgi:hypothetical protein